VAASDCRVLIGNSGSEKACVARNKPGENFSSTRTVEAYPAGSTKVDWRDRYVVNEVLN